MSGAGGKGVSNRALFEAVGFMVLLALAVLEMHLVFHNWWGIWDKWFERNFLTPSLLIIGQMMGPVAIYLGLRSTGRQMGEEAEDIGRGMRR